jgi:ABC-type branched-subunit amino acid transport system substrate-binding protein
MKLRGSKLAKQAMGVVATACVLAACGSSGDSGATADSSPDTTAVVLTGPPVTIGIIYLKDDAIGQDSSNAADALEAAISAQEARGGINGSPINVKTCTSKSNDPNGGAACAQQMVDDPSVVAVVGSANSSGDSISPILEQAGIAIIASLPTATADYTSPVAFPVMSGAVGGPGAATLLYDSFGVSKISLGFPDLSAAATLPILFNQALDTRGIQLSGQVRLPLDKQDLSAEAAQLANEGDGIVITALPDQFARLVQSGMSSGTWTDKKISTFTTSINDDVKKSLGSLTEGIYVASAGFALTTVDAPGVNRYRDEMAQYGKGLDIDDDVVKNSWLGFQVFVAAVKGAPTIARPSVLSGMNALVYDPEGMAPLLDFTKPNTTVFGGAVPRAFNTSVMYGQVKDGEFVALTSKFADPYVAP